MSFVLSSKHFLRSLGSYLSLRNYSTGGTESCKLLVLGAGTGGCSIAAKFASKFGKGNVIIVDPAETHYYQPMLTLVGGGIKPLKEVGRPMSSVIPRDAKWICDSVQLIDPKNNLVTTAKGVNIKYDFLVVALGLELHYNKVKGLEDALSIPASGVCSNYSPQYVERTYETLRNFKGGNAIFTFPHTLIKCAGAPLKACLISEHYIRNAGVKSKSFIYYKTALPVIFSVKRYANKLMEICYERNIDVAFKEELIEVKPDSQEAVFRDLNQPTETKTLKYSMLHAVPPMGPPQVLKNSPGGLADSTGFLRVNKLSLQHEAYPNIFGIGDNTNLPTSKTAAAIAAQSGVLYDNLLNVMNGKAIEVKYDGYTSCPLVTGFGTCIMAEFDYNLEPLETFPINQCSENRLMYHVKKDFMPVLYWNAMLKGYWNGPKVVRKILHFGMGK